MWNFLDIFAVLSEWESTFKKKIIMIVIDNAINENISFFIPIEIKKQSRYAKNVLFSSMFDIIRKWNNFTIFVCEPKNNSFCMELMIVL